MAANRKPHTTPRSIRIQRRQYVERCRRLLEKLDPNHPPARARRNTYRWQYWALQERVELYDELLSEAENSTRNRPIEKAESAIDLSLRYFTDVLKPPQEHDD